MAAVALDVEEAVDVEVSVRGLKLELTKTGMVGFICSMKFLLLSRTTISDIVGLVAAVA